MRTVLILALLLLAAAAAPAAARWTDKPSSGPVLPPEIFSRDSGSPGPSVGRELRDVRRRVDRARDGGLLSRGEARGIRRELRQVGRLKERYGRDGLSAMEAAELRTRTQILREAVARPRLVRAGGR